MPESCEVATNGARIEVSFPGVQLGVFEGRLQYTVYKGTNLIRQEVVAKTSEPSVAYKYDAGLKGMEIQPAVKLAWRDLTNLWQEYRFGAASNENPITVKTSNRLLAAEVPGGSIAAFPAAAQFLLGARNRLQPRLQLVSQRQRIVLLVRRPAGRERRKRGRRRPRLRGSGARTSRFAARGRVPGSGCPCTST